jgi:hypothetical protein
MRRLAARWGEQLVGCGRSHYLWRTRERSGASRICAALASRRTWAARSDAEAKEALELSISIMSPEIFERLACQLPPWTRPEDYNHYIEGLRKAGWKGCIGPTT